MYVVQILMQVIACFRMFSMPVHATGLSKETQIISCALAFWLVNFAQQRYKEDVEEGGFASAHMAAPLVSLPHFYSNLYELDSYNPLHNLLREMGRAPGFLPSGNFFSRLRK